MNWRKRKKELDKEKVVILGFPPENSKGDVVTLQNHISDWTDKSGKILVELEEEKKVATLRDLLTETYDIYIDGDIYFCVPKFGKINQDYEYEERDIAELDCEIGQIDGFRARDGRGRFVAVSGMDFATTDSVISLSTAAWTPPAIENPELPQGRIMEWTDKKEITDNTGMNSGADT